MAKTQVVHRNQFSKSGELTHGGGPTKTTIIARETTLDTLDPLILRDLMRRYQAGEATAADELITRLNPTLARYLYATSASWMHLDDLLQDCWLRIHKARGSYQPGEPVLPWILAIVRHTRVDSFRKWQRTSGRETELPDNSAGTLPNPFSTSNGKVATQSLMDLVRALPEAQREVVVMLKLTGMSVQEVALATGTTPGAVKQRAYRAYQTIRQALQVKENRRDVL
jgi:RNA polymerase sigma-70 factor (ECF subfamily)